jgi:hypothetical protein
VKFAELRLRAGIKAGEISRELEKAIPQGRGPVSLPTALSN